MDREHINAAVEKLEERIDDTGILVFFSSYGKHEVTISINGDATIYEVGSALRAFLLATGFTESLVSEILDAE